MITFLSLCVVNTSISSLRYDRLSQTMICTSTGGPATTVTWSRDGDPIRADQLATSYQEVQLVTSTKTATYENHLRLVSKSSSLSGNYTCSVGNSEGESNASIEISGQGGMWLVTSFCVVGGGDGG